MQSLDGLNSAQKQAVLATEGPVLVLAGAGSGKTRVLTRRVAYLLEQGVSPHKILAITFTNKAADEMKERVVNLVGDVADRSMWISTFHSFCVRVLRRDIGELGYDSHFTIYDAHDQQTIVKDSIRELNLDSKQWRPGPVAAAISNAKNQLLSPAEYESKARTYFEERVAQVYHVYQKKLVAGNGLDFDDLLRVTVHLFENHPAVLEKWQNRFEYVLVDEYQDTNYAQYRLVQLLVVGHKNLFVVGDADQSIYGWRGADVQNILNFERDYPDCTTILLEQNYRSTQNILDAANSVIAHNISRHEKRLFTQRKDGRPVTLFRAANEHREAQFVRDEALRLKTEEGYNWADIAVLYRTHAQSRVFEETFMNAGLPYTMVGGTKFYERREIRDIVGYLRLLTNPWDEVSLQRVINVPRRGIGQVTLERFAAYAQQHGLDFLETARQAENIATMTARQQQAVAGFAEVLDTLARQAPFLELRELVEELLTRSGYRADLEQQGDLEALTRLENIKEFLSVADEFARANPEGDLGQFLEHIALITDVDTYDDDADAVVLMTLHSAKGLEFPVVFLVGLEESVFPHSRSSDSQEELEEERRLCYVGMTRAQDHLYLTHATRRTLWGASGANLPSRFLDEVDSDVVDTVEDDWYEESDSGRWRGGLPSSGELISRVSPRRYQTAASSHGEDGSTFSPGDKVRHPKWGTGTVISCEPSGDDLEVTVAFPANGIRRVLQSYAGLEKVRKDRN